MCAVQRYSMMEQLFLLSFFPSFLICNFSRENCSTQGELFEQFSLCSTCNFSQREMRALKDLAKGDAGRAGRADHLVGEIPPTSKSQLLLIGYH